MRAHEKKHYLVSLDILRTLAIAAVVMIHTTTKSLDVTGYHVEKTRMSLFLNQAARFAVPLFFFISGFVLELNYKDEFRYSTYFKKRASRIILPYIFWSIIYEFIIHGQQTFSVLSWPFLKTLLLGTASYQLYFIPSLIIFYLCFPLLHNHLKSLKKKIIFIPLIILEIGLLIVDYQIKQIHLPTPIRIALLNYLLFLLGMIASHYQERILALTKRFLKQIVFCFVLILSLVYIQSDVLFLNTRNITYIYSQYHPTIVLYTLLLFGLIFYFFNGYKKHIKKIALLSRLSFFIFFIHVAILEFLWDKVLLRFITQSNGDIIKTFWFDPAVFLGVTGISFVIAFFIHKIPKLSFITG